MKVRNKHLGWLFILNLTLESEDNKINSQNSPREYGNLRDKNINNTISDFDSPHKIKISNESESWRSINKDSGKTSVW